MYTEVKNFMEEMIVRNAEEAIALAEKGQLSPHWQECARRDIESYLSTSYGEVVRTHHLKTRLELAINSTVQISDLEDAEAAAVSRGWKMVYYFVSPDYWTHMEVYELKHPDYRYSASISIDREAAGEDLDAYAAWMLSYLDLWAKGEGITLQKGEKMDSIKSFREQFHFNEMSEVLQYFTTVLANPETMLT